MIGEIYICFNLLRFVWLLCILSDGITAVSSIFADPVYSVKKREKDKQLEIRPCVRDGSSA